MANLRRFDLERHSQRELEDARVAGGGDSAERARTAIAVGQTQVDVVKGVEGFKAELDFETLADREIFMQSKVECGGSGTAQRVPSRRAIRAELIDDEGAGIEPLQHLLSPASAIGQTPVFQLIWTLPTSARARVVHAACDRERVAGLKRQNASQVPAADERVDHPLVETDRQFPQPGCGENMRVIEIRRPLIEALIERVGARHAGLLVLGAVVNAARPGV